MIEESTGTAYVCDLGIAIREEDYLQENRIVGTPVHMSPEQARGEGHRLDGRSDIYSLRVVLYEMIVGKRPFRGSTSNELMHQMITAEPINPRSVDESVPAELERICLNAFSKRASDSYATAAAFSQYSFGIPKLQPSVKPLQQFWLPCGENLHGIAVTGASGDMNHELLGASRHNDDFTENRNRQPAAAFANRPV